MKGFLKELLKKLNWKRFVLRVIDDLAEEVKDLLLDEPETPNRPVIRSEAKKETKKAK